MANRKASVSNKAGDKLSPRTGKSTNYKPDRQLHRVLPVRLTADKLELIRKEANELGIGPSTLARIWIMESLRKAVGNHDGNGHSLEEDKTLS